jgi:hypothetical protein
VTEDAPDAERFLALVAGLAAEDPQLTPVQAALLVAADLGIARDSRTFARILGLPHAVVLREMAVLAERSDLLRIGKRDARTLRTHYTLGADAQRYAALPGLS